MYKTEEKCSRNYRNIYGESLIFHLRTNNDCLQVSIGYNKPNSLLGENTILIFFLCAIVFITSLLGVNLFIVILSSLLISFILYKHCFFVTEEQLFIVKGFGCHISKQFFYRKSTIFIPYEKIHKVFINEVIFRNKVIYLLTLLTKDQAKNDNFKLEPLFMGLLPRIDCIQLIYRHIKYLDDR